MRPITPLLTGIVLLVAANFANAATINWGSGATAVAADTDISTLGTLIDAHNYGGSTTCARL